jgi:RHO1 GDP-GTP exchange protein 1/2
MHPSITSSDRPISSVLSPSWDNQPHPPSSWVQTKLQIHRSQLEDQYMDDDGSIRRPSAYEEDILDDYEEEEEEEAEVNEIRFFQPAFLSEAALQLRYRVERSRQMKAGIAWVGSFTGRDIVVS